MTARVVGVASLIVVSVVAMAMMGNLAPDRDLMGTWRLVSYDGVAEREVKKVTFDSRGNFDMRNSDCRQWGKYRVERQDGRRILHVTWTGCDLETINELFSGGLVAQPNLFRIEGGRMTIKEPRSREKPWPPVASNLASEPRYVIAVWEKTWW